MAVCPHCNAEITGLDYNCSTVGWETGTIDYSSDPRGREGTIDYSYSDGATDETDNYTFTCPDCGDEIDIPNGDVAAWFHAQEIAAKKKEAVKKKAVNTLGNFPKRKKLEVI